MPGAEWDVIKNVITHQFSVREMEWQALRPLDLTQSSFMQFRTIWGWVGVNPDLAVHSAVWSMEGHGSLKNKTKVTSLMEVKWHNVALTGVMGWSRSLDCGVQWCTPFGVAKNYQTTNGQRCQRYCTSMGFPGQWASLVMPANHCFPMVRCVSLKCTLPSPRGFWAQRAVLL